MPAQEIEISVKSKVHDVLGSVIKEFMLLLGFVQSVADSFASSTIS